MISRKILSLPYGLKLPVSLLIETVSYYEAGEFSIMEQDAAALLTNYVEQGIQSEMRAGEILQHTMSMEEKNGCYVLTSVVECHEMIADTVEAKWNEEDFIYDRKNG